MNRLQKGQLLAITGSSGVVIAGFYYGLTGQSTYLDITIVYSIIYLVVFALLIPRFRRWVREEEHPTTVNRARET